MEITLLNIDIGDGAMLLALLVWLLRRRVQRHPRNPSNSDP